MDYLRLEEFTRKNKILSARGTRIGGIQMIFTE